MTTKERTFGDVILTFTDQFDFRWNDAGSEASRDGAFWHPRAPSGFHALGSVAVPHFGDINGTLAAVCVKAADPGSGSLQSPEDYQLIWNDAGSGADRDGTCWRPIAPAGYVALGDVFVEGSGKPSVDDVKCVREDLAAQAEIGALIWDDSDSGADADFGAWEISTPDSYTDSEKGLFAPNTFVGNNQHAPPPSAPVLYCLNLPVPFDEIQGPASPKLTSTNPPPELTGETTDRVVYLPFTAFDDKDRDVRWKVENSPFYAIERQVAYKTEIFDHNQTSQEQVIEESITTGISKTATETFSVTTGISVTTESGVKAFGTGGKVSVTVSVELGYESSTSVTTFKETTLTKSINVPPQKAVALWAISYRLQVKRTDNSFVGSPLAFEGDYFVHDEYPD